VKWFNALLIVGSKHTTNRGRASREANMNGFKAYGLIRAAQATEYLCRFFEAGKLNG